MSLQYHRVSSAMKRNTLRSESRREGIHQSEKVFQDISRYFSEEEWAKLSKWHKSAYFYMKQNYVRMTGLGVNVNLPVFMRSKEQATGFPVSGLDKDHPNENKDEKTKRNCSVPQINCQKMQKEAESERNYRRSMPGTRRSRGAQRCRYTWGKAHVSGRNCKKASGTRRSHRLQKCKPDEIKDSSDND